MGPDAGHHIGGQNCQKAHVEQQVDVVTEGAKTFPLIIDKIFCDIMNQELLLLVIIDFHQWMVAHINISRESVWRDKVLLGFLSSLKRRISDMFVKIFILLLY